MTAPGVAGTSAGAALLDAKGVNVVYEPARGVRIWAVRDVDLSLKQGEFVGLVGESGCGKSTLGFALTRLLRPPARLESGEILFDGKDIALLDGEDLREQRRGGFALVLQSGMNALNPVRSVAKHFNDILKAHARGGRSIPKRRYASGARNCSRRCDSTPTCSIDSRTSCPAACGSGCRSRWRWRWSQE